MANGIGASNRIVDYLRGTRTELRKVVWPTRDEAMNLTAVVLLVTVVMTLILGGIDYVFTIVLNLILSFGR